MKQKLFKTMLLLCALIVGSGTAWAEEVTYTFTNKSWAASPANWTSGQDGAGFSNNGIQVTTAATGANGTSPVSFTNVTKIVATYNTNKSKGAGTIEAKIGENDAVSKNWAYSGSADGTSSYFTVQWDYETPQSGYVNIKCNTTTNSIYLVSVTITAAGGGGSTTYTVTYDANGGSGTMTDSNSPYDAGASVTVLDNTFTREGYTFSKWNTAANGSGTDYSAGNTFTINANTTLYAQWTENSGGGSGDEQWVLTDLADLTSTDVFVIVGNNGSNYAMSNNNGTGSAPTAVAVTIANDAITSTVASTIQWTVSGNATDGYTFYPNGETETWLYCINNNNGLRVGTGENKLFSITDDYLYNEGQLRYIGIYNSQDWRSYTSINANITGQTFAFYKKVTGGVVTPANEVTFSYEDYRGWNNDTDYGVERTMQKTDVDITNNYFYTPQGYHYIQFTATNGNGTVTITPKNGATITKIKISASAEFNGGEITPSTGTVSKNTEGTVITWDGEASAAFTLKYKSHIRWTSIVVTYTGGLPKCATPEISGEENFYFSTEITISCATEGATISYILSNSKGVTNHTYTGPFTIDESTQVRATATKEGMATSDETIKTFTKLDPLPNIGSIRGSVNHDYVQLTNALVTYKNGKYAYLEDNSGAILLYDCAGDLEAGDKLTGMMHITDYTVYNGLPEIKAFEMMEGYTKTSGNEVIPTEMTLAELLMQDEAYPYEFKLSKYIKIVDATVTSAFASKNCTIQQGEYSIVLHDNGSASLTSTVNDVVTVTGHVAIYGDTKQIAVFEQSQIVVGTVPSIAVSPNTVEATAAETEGTLDITYANLPISDMNDFDIQYYDAEGNEIAEPAEPAWIDVLVAEQDPKIGEGYVVSYYMIENDGAARTAYFKVYAMDAETNLVYSNLVTVNQAAPVSGDQFALFTGDLVEGDYIIYYNGKAMNTTVTNNRLQYEEVTPEGNTITTDDSAIVWHIAKSGDYWTIYNAEANAYAAANGTRNQAQMLADGTDDKALWTITGTETYEFVNKSNAANSINANLRNNGTYGFACYAVGTGGELSLYKKVTESVTLNAYGYATFCSTNALDFSDDSKFSAWQITGTSGSTITFEQITGTVAAETGVLLKGSAFGIITIPVAASGSTLSSNLLVGITTPTDVTAGQYYGLSGDKFVKVGAGTVPAGKALLPASAVGSSIKAFNFVFEDDPDGINSIDNGELTIDNAAIYNLAGQRLSKMQKGINIVNGKKILK